MRTTLFSDILLKILPVSALFFALVLLSAALPAWATETKEAARASGELHLTVHPPSGKPGQTRTVFVQQLVRHNSQCGPVDATFDTSRMETQNLVLVTAKVRQGYLCAPLLPRPQELLYRFDAEITPTTAGPLTIRWADSGAEVTIQTFAAMAASKFNANGMWFDAATNGSGIAMHHRPATSDVAFGTWFLFDNWGVGRWYALQSATWLQDGSVLEGLLYRLEGHCRTINLSACPSGATFRDDTSRNSLWQVPSRARITFQSSTRARAEVLTLGGTAIFTAELTKLAF